MKLGKTYWLLEKVVFDERPPLLHTSSKLRLKVGSLYLNCFKEKVPPIRMLKPLSGFDIVPRLHVAFLYSGEVMVLGDGFPKLSTSRVLRTKNLVIFNFVTANAKCIISFIFLFVRRQYNSMFTQSVRFSVLLLIFFILLPSCLARILFYGLFSLRKEKEMVRSLNFIHLIFDQPSRRQRSMTVHTATVS